MVVILSKYRKDEFMVTSNDVLKCKHMTEGRARAFASSLAGDDDYIDETGDKPEKKKKDNKKK